MDNTEVLLGMLWNKNRIEHTRTSRERIQNFDSHLLYDIYTYLFYLQVELNLFPLSNEKKHITSIQKLRDETIIYTRWNNFSIVNYSFWQGFDSEPDCELVKGFYFFRKIEKRAKLKCSSFSGIFILIMGLLSFKTQKSSEPGKFRLRQQILLKEYVSECSFVVLSSVVVKKSTTNTCKNKFFLSYKWLLFLTDN